ncbi:hypothetical protein BKA63DRAFT_490209 [Paraphoma chrysanthemicola]|nr:hypothetical protein BKA63DRAFT_490209 [Paraphoma chrysanthemicola]
MLNYVERAFTHLLKFSSYVPFHLLKFTLLPSGETALLIRTEPPFPLLSLPLHIRTKIFTVLLKHFSPTIPITLKSKARTVCSPDYHGRNTLTLLRSCKQLHTEATPLVYAQTLTFPGTQIASSFLLSIGSNRRLLRSLRSETYASSSARTMFHLLSEAHNIQRLSFAHVSSSETPAKAVQNIWKDAGAWLSGLDRADPVKGLEVLRFDERAFHVREKDGKGGGYRVMCWGAAEQMEFLEGLRARMVGVRKGGKGDPTGPTAADPKGGRSAVPMGFYEVGSEFTQLVWFQSKSRRHKVQLECNPASLAFAIIKQRERPWPKQPAGHIAEVDILL